MIYCPACQPGDANRGFIPVLCTSCKDKLAADRRERVNAARLARRDAERAEDFGPNGDATTPGFFFDREDVP